MHQIRTPEIPSQKPSVENLTSERRGYNVLFYSMPWSFAVIKTAWMPEPLYVECV